MILSNLSLLKPVILAAICLAIFAPQIEAQASMPYQGDIGATFGPLTDTCAFEFGLFDATAGGAQIGSTISRTIEVNRGRFEAELDFGDEASDGGSRYLEVAVGCPADTATLTTLTRRAFNPPPPTEAMARSGGGTRAGVQVVAQGGAQTKEALGTAFTYQGELRQSGAPVSGAGDFQFSMWDALAGGAQVGSTVKVNTVTVVDGRFTAQLDFGAAAFSGDARWLEIEVDFPSGTGNMTTLSPRQALSPAPYALQTRGLFVDDAGKVGVGTTIPTSPLHVEGDGSRTLRVRNNAASGGAAIGASATASSGYAVGLDAYSASPDGVGVYAFNEAESGNGYAVAAETNSPDGVAVFGHAANGDQFSTGIGVHGRSDGDDLGAGVYGEATASAGYSYGVHGVAGAGAGVRGDHQGTGNYGTLGEATTGVVGHVDGATDYAGYFTGGRNYFEGDVGIGTVDPTSDLHVAGDARVDGRLWMSAGADISFVSTNTRVFESSGSLYLLADQDIQFTPDRDIYMDGTTFVVDGLLDRVGVGISAPAEALDVDGNVRTSGDYTYSSRRTFAVYIPAFAFSVRYSADDKFSATLNFGYITAGSSPHTVDMFSRVIIPDGAQMEEITFYYSDTDATNDLHLHGFISRRAMENPTGGSLATWSVSTSGSSSSIQSLTVDSVASQIIDNSLYTYNISLDWTQDVVGSSLGFFGCRIEYSLNSLNP